MSGRCNTCKHYSTGFDNAVIGICRNESAPLKDTVSSFGCIHHEEKLKPCPFCGGEAEQVYQDFTTKCMIRCTNCQVEQPVRNDVYAIKAWNTRHEPYKERADRVLKSFRDYIKKNPDAFCGVGEPTQETNEK